MSSIQLDEEKDAFWKDPKFLLAALPSLLAVASMLGWLPNSDTDTANEVVGNVIKSGFSFATAAVLAWQYFAKNAEVVKTKLTLRQELVKEELRETIRVREELRVREALQQK